MHNQNSIKEALEIAPNIFWVGMHLENDPFQCHPYLIKNGSESILIDPGSMLEFEEVVRKTASIVPLNSIKYIILHHQDPDLVAAVPEIEKLINRDDLLIVTHSRMSLLIKHYMVKSSYYEIDKNNLSLSTQSGLKLNFHTTPYCHSPGAFVTYEPKTKVLFSGDIFGGIEESWNFYADESYFESAKLFHQEYMPSKDIFNYALNKIQKLDIELIAPQHGSIIEKKYIPKLIEDMKNLDCGLYIEKKYNQELLDTIAQLREKEKTIKEQNILLAEQSKRAEIGEIMQNIAHQWRQPLAIINTSVAIMKEKNRQKLLLQDEIEEKLQKMEQKIIYLSQTIEDFMNYYKPQKEKSRFFVKNAIEKSLNIINILQNEEKVKIEYNVKPDIKLYASFNEFTQVLVTLFSNINDLIVIKNLKDVHILITLQKEGNATILSIADNCGGIAPNNLTKIFDPYFTTKHKSMGIGLGLHIAKTIIEQSMQGSLRAENIYDSSGTIVGAKFIIEIKDED
ncbi:MAG: hypothetical protein QG559_676 [Campylobacterota bacterium]|nr:hypothetical protein [Campylobacterota bacterium]